MGEGASQAVTEGNSHFGMATPSNLKASSRSAAHCEKGVSCYRTDFEYLPALSHRCNAQSFHTISFVEHPQSCQDLEDDLSSAWQ